MTFTVSAGGQPDVTPVGYEFDGTHFYIGGFNPTNTRRSRNVRAGNDKVALASTIWPAPAPGPRVDCGCTAPPN